MRSFYSAYNKRGAPLEYCDTTALYCMFYLYDSFYTLLSQ
jgi:hypothetical protein